MRENTLSKPAFDIQKSDFENGFSVIHARTCPYEMASVQLWVRTGSSTEGRFSGAGISHLLEHMLFKGYGGKDAAELAASVRKIGGEMNAYTSYDRTVYHIDLPSEHIGKAVAILAAMVYEPNLNEEDVALEKEVVLSEIDMVEDDPDEVLFKGLMRTAYCDHPARHPQIGNAKLLVRLAASDLREYIDGRYVPENMFLSVASKLEHKTVFNLAKRYFGKRAYAAKTGWQIPDESVQLAPREARFESKDDSARAQIAFKISAGTLGDRAAFEALSFLLTHGRTGVLQKKFKYATPLADYIDSQNLWEIDNGLFLLTLLTSPEKIKKATDAIINELENFGDYSEPEIEKFVKKTLFYFDSLKKSSSDLATAIGDGEFPRLGKDFIPEYLDAVCALKPDDLKHAALSLKESARTIAVMSPPSVSKSKKTYAESGNVLPKTIALPNGSKIILIPDGGESNVYFRFVSLGGPWSVEKSRRSLCGLTALMLSRGIGGMDSETLAEFTESRAIRFSSSCGNNTVSICAESLADDADVCMELISGAVFNARFDKEAFVRERDILVSNLLDEHEDPFERGLLGMRRKFFGDAPLAISPDGLAREIKKASHEDAKKLYKKMFLSGDCIMSVCGKFDEKHVVSSLKAWMKDIPPGLREIPKASSLGHIKKNFSETFVANQSVIFAAYPCGGVFDERGDLCAEILSEMMGGSSGYVFESVREAQGLAYAASAETIHGIDRGVFYLYALSQKKNVGKILDLFDLQAKRMADGDFEADRFEDAKLKLKTRLMSSMQNPSQRAMNAAIYSLYGRKMLSSKQAFARVDSISPAEIRAFAKKNFKAAMTYVLK